MTAIAVANMKSQHSFRVSIVIPTFNRRAELNETLTALKQQTFQDFEVIVVDNSSTDSTCEMIKIQQNDWGDRLRYYVKEPNGPAAARNYGAERSCSDFVLFQDSDICLKEDWLEKALIFIEKSPQIYAVSGAVVYDFDRERVNAFGGNIGITGLAWDNYEDTLLADLPEKKQQIWANCSAMLVERQSIFEVGQFDDRFFYGYEDSDFGWALNVLGKQLWCLKSLIAYHRVDPQPGQSNSIIVHHYCKNRLSSLIQNASFLHLFYKLPLYLIYQLLDSILRSPRKAKLMSLWWNIRNIKTTLSRRRLIQSNRKTSERAIFALDEIRMFPPKALHGQRRRPVLTDKQVGKINSIDDRV